MSVSTSADGKPLGSNEMSSAGDLETWFFLQEYSNLFAFLGKHEYLKKKSINKANTNEEDLRAGNLLFVYGDYSSGVNDFRRWAANELRSSKEYIFVKFDVANLRKSAASKNGLSLGLTKWFVDAFGESDMLISKKIVDFVEGDDGTDAGDVEAVLNGVANVVDIIIGASGFGVAANALAVFKLLADVVNNTRAQKAIKKINTTNIKKRIKNAEGDRSSIFNPECPLEFVIYDLYRILEKNEKKLVIFLENYAELFTNEIITEDGKNPDDVIWDLISKQTEDIISWIFIGNEKPSKDIEKYLFEKNIWNLSRLDGIQTRFYLEKRLRQLEDQYDFSGKRYFKEWCKEVFNITNGDKFLLDGIINLQNDEKYNFGKWLVELRDLDDDDEARSIIRGNTDKLAKFLKDWILHSMKGMVVNLLEKLFEKEYMRSERYHAICYIASIADLIDKPDNDHEKYIFAWKSKEDFSEIRIDGQNIIESLMLNSPLIKYVAEFGGSYCLNVSFLKLLLLFDDRRKEVEEAAQLFKSQYRIDSHKEAINRTDSGQQVNTDYVERRENEARVQTGGRLNNIYGIPLELYGGNLTDQLRFVGGAEPTPNADSAGNESPEKILNDINVLKEIAQIKLMQDLAQNLYKMESRISVLENSDGAASNLNADVPTIEKPVDEEKRNDDTSVNPEEDEESIIYKNNIPIKK